MEETNRLPGPSPTGGDLFSGIWALIEVIMVALAASFLVGTGFHVFSIDGAEILSNTRLTFLYLALESSLTLLLIALLLAIRGQSFREIGWDWGRPAGEILIGLYWVPLLFVTNFLVGGVFELFLPGWVSQGNPLIDSIGDFQDLGLLLISSILVGGIKEEIQRAFVFNRFEFDLGRLLGRILSLGSHSVSGRRLGLILGLVLWSCFFGLGHVAQGYDSAVGAGLLGFWFGVLYIWRRNLVAVVVAHSLFDVITLLVFWNLFR